MKNNKFKLNYARLNSNIDCVVYFDPSKESLDHLSIKILHHMFMHRLRHNKPVILGVFGKSGEGKSESIASLIEELMKVNNLDLIKYFNVINAFTPLQYSDKLNKIMFDKDYKEVKFIVIHEAREVIKANLWYSFVNMAIADINAMARSVKRLMTVIISQGLRDIDKGMRSTLTHYAKIERPLNGNAKMYLRVIYEDDTIMERPQLKRRKPKIRLIYPDKRSRILSPNYIEIPRASEEVRKLLEKYDNEAKAPLIKKKLKGIQEELEKDLGTESITNKAQATLEFYTKDNDRFRQIMVKSGGRWTIDKSFQEMLGFDKKETKKFREDILKIATEKKLLEEIKNDQM